jgi:hypothetical protein
MATRDPWLEVGTTSLGGDGFNVWICFFVEADQESHEIALLEKNTTFDEAKGRAVAVAKNARIKLYHRFGKDGFELIPT